LTYLDGRDDETYPIVCGFDDAIATDAYNLTFGLNGTRALRTVGAEPTDIEVFGRDARQSKALIIQKSPFLTRPPHHMCTFDAGRTLLCDILSHVSCRKEIKRNKPAISKRI